MSCIFVNLFIVNKRYRFQLFSSAYAVRLIQMSLNIVPWGYRAASQSRPDALPIKGELGEEQIIDLYESS